MVLNKYIEHINKHYSINWKNYPNIKTWKKGPIDELNQDFCILEFPPTKEREMWTYGTCCMSLPNEEEPIELHIFSYKQDENLVELLTIIAHYHKNVRKLGLWHTVNFGRPWQKQSLCEYGLVSLPYLDGPTLENMYLPEYDENLKFFWLIPITEEEVNFKTKMSIESLEQKFEERNFEYANPHRESVI